MDEKETSKGREKKAAAGGGFDSKAEPSAEARLSDKRDEEKLRGIWSRAMALRGLKKVMNVSLEAAKIPTLDENGQVLEVKFNPSAANAATKAIETANKMLGYNLHQDEDESDDEDERQITVIFENAEEYSE